MERESLTIRVRIIALLTLLAVMAVSEALLVLYFQRLTQQTRQHVDQRAAVRDLQSRLELSLLEMKSSERDALRTGVDGPVLESTVRDYTSLLSSLYDVTLDPHQRERLDGIARNVDRWRSSWRRPGRTAGRDTIEGAVSELEAAFAPIGADLVSLRLRQEQLYNAAQDTSRRTFGRYTAVMLLIPAVAILVMGVAIAAVRRVLLDPLAALAADSERIAKGEYPSLKISPRRDEIGVLINAFIGMIDTLHNREAEISGALALSRDLTARHKRSEEEAYQSRAELDAVIETVPAALMLLDKATSVRRQNRAATRLIGPPPDGDNLEADIVTFSLAGRDGLELPPPRWPLVRALGGETVPGEEILVRTPDGRELPMLVSAAPMVDAAGRTWGAVAVLQDLSALKAIDRLKDEFVSIVSHELRTPLTSIRGSLQLVLDDEGSVPDEDHRQLVQIALNNCERLIRIINDILDVAKIDAGKTALTTRPAAVRDLVHTAIESVEGVARAASVAFVLDLQDDLPPVEADSDRIVQVLVNLLSNAVKFAPPRSRVTIEASRRDRMIEISITDRGKGIEAEDLPKLFQKFQQLDASTTRAKGGTGLGLAIVRGLVEQHGGTVSVESRRGEGARFSFTLPISSAALPAHMPANASRAAAGAARVLIVDDDDDFRGVTRRHLERAGFRVTEARNGVEALAAARASRPDVITLDLLMPGMNGWTLIRNLNDDAALSGIPTVVLSAVADRAGNLGRDVAVIAKASGVEALLAEVTSLLAAPGAGEVLVAEDDDDLRSLLARTLRKHGFTTREAHDGAEALAMVDDGVSLLLLDLNMPGIDGLDVLRRVRERADGRQIPVLVITGTEGLQESAMALGASGYLTKPIEVAEVASVVRRLIARQ